MKNVPQMIKNKLLRVIYKSVRKYYKVGRTVAIVKVLEKIKYAVLAINSKFGHASMAHRTNVHT
jgi:hypothetical protein